MKLKKNSIRYNFENDSNVVYSVDFDYNTNIYQLFVDNKYVDSGYYTTGHHSISTAKAIIINHINTTPCK